MPDLLLELLSEEIPARMQKRAARDLESGVTEALTAEGLSFEGTYSSATPRRLVLHVRGVQAATDDIVEERKGPRVGAPEQAIAGFVKAAGLSSIAEADIVSDPKKGDFYLARTNRPGRPASEIVEEIVPKVVRGFPWPKSMRWGAASASGHSLRWVRPLTSIVCTFGPETETPDVIDFPLDDIPVGDVTRGHRFMSPGPITVRRLDDYVAALNRAHVVVDLGRRRDMIVHDARDRALALGCTLVEDDRLLDEVAGLVEWPTVLVGRFDEAFLDLPEEVVRLTIRENQKCFVMRDQATGRLQNAFVLTANIEAPDGGAAIVAGNERVVRARLSDARFFLETDRALPLTTHAKRLAAVTFHERLGSQADRVERLARLAREIAPSVGADPEAAETAARLMKADLVTGLVGEFPELQGYVGRHYAALEGYAAPIADAIEAHYRPLGPSDAVPDEPVAIAAALADKIDMLVAMWAIDEKPTGSKDPFALRRAALGIIRTVLVNGLDLPLQGGGGRLGPLPFAHFELMTQLPTLGTDKAGNGEEPAAAEGPANPFGTDRDAALQNDLVGFIFDRLKVQLRQDGARHDLVDAVIARQDGCDLLRIARRVEALGGFLETGEGADLLSGYRRAASIFAAEQRKDGGDGLAGQHDPALLAEPAERALAEAIGRTRTVVASALTASDDKGALHALAELRGPIDAFFEETLVNVDNPTIRKNRLRLVAAIPETTAEIADFGLIEG